MRKLTLLVTCPICGKEVEIEVKSEDYFYWQQGAVIQDAMPYLTPQEREMLISGVCPTCWEDMWEGFDEEE